MFFKEIEDNYRLKKKVLSCNNAKEVLNIYKEIVTYYGIDDRLPISVTDSNVKFAPFNDADKMILTDYLDSKISTDFDDTILKIIEFIDEGNTIENDSKKIKKYLCKVLTAYDSHIKVDKSIRDYIYGPDEIVFSFTGVLSKEIVDGVVLQLRDYAKSIMNKEIEQKNNTSKWPYVNVNNYNYNNAEAKSSSNLDLKFLFNDTREKANALFDNSEKLQEVLDKISELEKCVNMKMDKKSLWERLKSTIKWTIEQGIQVTTLMMPLVMQLLK